MRVGRDAAQRFAETSRLKLHRDRDCGEVSIGGVTAKIVETLKVDAAGTMAAINSANLGVAAISALPSGKGGARNRRDRTSYYLTGPQVANVIAAAEFALQIGLPLNRMITVHWQAAGLPLERMAWATGKLLDLASKTFSRRGGRTAWIFVHEGGEKKGGHCHILIHVPADALDALVRLQKRWLKAVTGKPYRAGVIKGKPIGGRKGLERSNPKLYVENVNRALSYLVKGTGEDVAKILGMARAEYGGLVIGKRCGTSQNIGQKARRLASVGSDVR